MHTREDVGIVRIKASAVSSGAFDLAGLEYREVFDTALLHIYAIEPEFPDRRDKCSILEPLPCPLPDLADSEASEAGMCCH